MSRPLLTKETSNDVQALRQALGAMASIQICLAEDLKKQNDIIAGLHMELAEAKVSERKFSNHCLEMQDIDSANEILEVLGHPTK